MRESRRLFVSTIIVCFFSISIFGCSINEFPFFEFNPKEYVFLGKVIGYTDEVETSFVSYNRTLKFTGFGLKIKVESIINLPRKAEIVEVFPTFIRDTACAPRGSSKNEIETAFPIGTRVRVIGQENSELLGNEINSVPKFQVSGANKGQLFNNINKNQKILTTTDSVFDYRQLLPLYNTKYTTAETFVWLFEIRKDLKRLTEATAENERFAILRRLAFAYDNYQDYGKLLQKYLQDKSQIEELLKLKANWEKKKLAFLKK